MPEFDIEKIKPLLAASLTRYCSLRNWFEWKEVKKTKEYLREEEIDLPVYSIPQVKYTVIRKSDMAYHGCFGNFTYGYSPSSVESRPLIVLKLFKKLIDERSNNHCWMNKDQLTYWIETGKEEGNLDFYYKIEEREDSFLIHIDFKKLEMVQMKFMLFWIRYIFEYPASLSALDAIILKRDFYPEESMNNLLSLTALAQIYGEFPIHASQCLGTYNGFITREEFQKRLNTRYSTYIQEIYPSTAIHSQSVYGIRLTPICNNENIKATKTFCPVRDWISNDKRFEQYQNLYNVLKEHEYKAKEVKK